MTLEAFALRPRNSAFHAAQALGVYPWMTEVEAHLGGGRVRARGREMIMMGGYSYFGLINHPRIHEDVVAAMKTYGVGTYGTRITSGTTTLHRQLECRIASKTRREDSVLFPSGLAANVSTIAALMAKGDGIFVDRLVHASIMDGCQQSGADVTVVRHNDASDLDGKLGRSDIDGNKLVVIDAVYSMDGDIANLPEIADVCRKHRAALMVDECHSLFVLGATGGGIEEHFGLSEPVIDVKTGALSKAIPGTGGFASGSRAMVACLKEHGRSFLFSGATAPPVVAAGISAMRILEEEPSVVKELSDKAEEYRRALNERQVDTGRSETSIVPIMIPQTTNCILASEFCMDAGVYVQPICYPAVPKGMDRLRTTVTTEHSRSDLRYAAETIGEAFVRFGRTHDGAMAGGARR